MFINLKFTIISNEKIFVDIWSPPCNISEIWIRRIVICRAEREQNIPVRAILIIYRTKIFKKIKKTRASSPKFSIETLSVILPDHLRAHFLNAWNIEAQIFRTEAVFARDMLFVNFVWISKIIYFSTRIKFLIVAAFGVRCEPMNMLSVD